MLDIFLLVGAVCMDSFIVSMVYGAQGIQIPLKSIGIIAFFGTLFLCCSLYLAQMLQQFIPERTCAYLSFVVLLLIGVTSLFQTQLKHYLNKHKEGTFMFQIKEISFVVDVFIDETKADADDSKILTAKEAVYLAIALSIDSLASGLAFGIGIENPHEVLMVSFAAGICILLLGQWIGRRISTAVEMDLSWMSGVMLLLLACTRLL